MKNQYFGDIYDYIKYGLLRQLSCNGQMRIAVCWMLTRNDERRHGHRIDYLRDPGSWRYLDPPAFDFLRSAILDSQERNIGVVEKSGLLPNTTFYSNLLTDASEERCKYFDGFLEFARGRELLFFDPDNGLEIKSVKYGQGGASRYLFLHEVSRSFKAGHSLLVYQHLPPKPRGPLMRGLARRLIHEVGSEVVYVFRTPSVAFFLVPQAKQAGQFAEITSRVQSSWGALLDIERYPA